MHTVLPVCRLPVAGRPVLFAPVSQALLRFIAFTREASALGFVLMRHHLRFARTPLACPSAFVAFKNSLLDALAQLRVGVLFRVCGLNGCRFLWC